MKAMNATTMAILALQTTFALSTIPVCLVQIEKTRHPAEDSIPQA